MDGWRRDLPRVLLSNGCGCHHRPFHSWLGWEVSHQDKAGVTYFLPSIGGGGRNTLILSFSSSQPQRSSSE